MLFRSERAKKRRLCSAVWKHWLSNTKNTKRLGIVAAAVVYRSKFRKKQSHMKNWLFVAKASTRLWLEGESAVQKLHYKRRHQVLDCFKAHLAQGKTERRLLAHVAWARDRKRKLDGLDAFAGQLIKKNIKTHVDTVLMHRARYLAMYAKTETNKHFLQYVDKIEIDEEKIDAKVAAEKEKERQRPDAREYK